MGDPTQTDGLVEAGKLGASGGFGMVALALIQRFFKKEDDSTAQVMAVLAEIKAGQVLTQASVVTLSSDVRLLTDRGVRSDAEQAQMRTELSDLRLKVAALEGSFKQLSSGHIIE